MAMPISSATATDAPDKTEAAAQQMEAAILRQLLTASGAFKPADVAGGQLRADMFIETLADAVAKGGGIGIARMLEDEIEKNKTPGMKSGARTAEAVHSTDVIDDGPDDDPASFAARKQEIGATLSHPGSDATLCAHAAQVPVKSGENGTYSGVVHRALNAYQKRAEETVVGKLQGPRTGDAP
jgi:Rod binding domain-containing protein